MTVTAGEAVEGAADAASASVYRVSRGRRVRARRDNVAFGTAVVDRYAPVNVPYSYEAVAFAESGHLPRGDVPVHVLKPLRLLHVRRAAAVAKARWDLQVSLDGRQAGRG